MRSSIKGMRFTLVIVATLVALIASIAPLAVPASYAQAEPEVLNIGVVGAPDSPTAEGITLAIQRLARLGPLATPDGKQYTLAVVTADATTPEEVFDALTKLKQSNVVAIFGPDDDTLAQASLAALTGAGVPVFTGATANAIQVGSLLFRTRAADNWRMAALADYMLTDLKKTKFAIYQGNDASGALATELVTVLTQRGTAPSPTVIQTPTGTVSDSAQVILGSTPDAVIALGESTQVAELYRILRGSGYTNTFATGRADDRLFISAIPNELRGGIIGATTWPYSWDSADSADFLRDYTALFGKIPTPHSAAAYDTTVALFIAMKNGGRDPEGIRGAILALPKSDSLQGFFNPTGGNNNLTVSSSVILTNRYGAPNLVARYEAAERVAIVTVPPTPFPTATLPPSPTPDGVVGTAKSTVNVRNGPGPIYPIIGQLRRGEQVQLVGASADFTWYVINFRAQQGWVSASLMTVFGDPRTLPVVAPPPTPVPSPTPPATLTPSPAPIADIILVSASINPPIPAPGQPFTVQAVIKNNGNVDAGGFGVATSFQPGEVYADAVVGGLPAGQQANVSLSGTVSGTGIFRVAIVLDLNNQVTEGDVGEANNKPEFAYKIDRTYVAQGQVNIAASNSADLEGGTGDISWDGTNLIPINGTKIGTLNVQLADVHYDFLTPDKVNPSQINIAGQTGMVIAIHTAEGKRGVLRVAGFSGSTLILDYFIYNP